MSFDRLFVYLTALSGASSYAIVFAILLLCGLGFPLPEDIPLIACGYLSWEGTMSLVPAFVLTMVGVGVGDSMLFFLGRRLGGRLRAPDRPVLFFTPKQLRRTRAYFRKYGDKIVFFARFVAGFRAVVFFMAGAMHMKYRRFALLDGLAALVSVPVWLAIGYFLGVSFGAQIGEILHRVHHIKTVATIVTLAVLIFLGIRMGLQYRRARRATEVPAE